MIEVTDPFNNSSGNKNLRLALSFIAFLITASLIAAKLYYENRQHEQKMSEQHWGKAFKSVLKDEGYAIDIGALNPYETLLEGNRYSNTYFGIATNFPDNWELDRGISELSVVRAFNADSALTIALIVFPYSDSTFIAGKNSAAHNSELLALQKKFQSDPVGFMEENSKVDHLTDVKALMQNGLNLTTYDYDFKSRRIGYANYAVVSYYFNQVGEDNQVTFKSISYETLLWGNKYTFSYTAPLAFFNINTIEEVLWGTSIINSKLWDSL